MNVSDRVIFTNECVNNNCRRNRRQSRDKVERTLLDRRLAPATETAAA